MAGKQKTYINIAVKNPCSILKEKLPLIYKRTEAGSLFYLYRQAMPK